MTERHNFNFILRGNIYIKKLQHLGVAMHICHPNYQGKHKIGGLRSKLGREKSETLSSK
jgi:hypothetical protein